jgi:signal transduction histidine kinase
MKNLIPDSIASRALLVLVVGLTVSHLLSVALYSTDRTSALMLTGGEHTGERIATIWRLVENAPQGERQRIIELADHPELHITWSRESAIEEQRNSSWQTDIFRNSLIDHLDAGGEQEFRLHYTTGTIAKAWQDHLFQSHEEIEVGDLLMVSLRLPEQSWINFAAPIESSQYFWSLRFVLSMAVMLLAVGLLSALVVRHLTKPLATFARAAQRLGTDVNAPSIPENGPAEVRQAIGAFNEMQNRIRRFVEDRTQMLAAISHDLGTPITRLRLRAEFIEDEEQQKKMLADLDDMEKMVFSSLSFARDEAAHEPHAMVDLRALLQRVCDDMNDSGGSITWDIGNDPVPYGCRPVALRRALTNLVDNAIKYGNRVHVSLEDGPKSILVRIDDDGPGIPDELQDDAFKPFQRLEASRNRETGGTGLGLTVARAIFRQHGGEITLENRQTGGFRVEITLPR